MQIAAHPLEVRSWTVTKKNRAILYGERTGKRRHQRKHQQEELRNFAWGIEQTATFHHQNFNKQLLREKKSPELCQFVSEGEKPAVRSNSPLIFLSCIKWTVPSGRFAGEQYLLIFTVYLMVSPNVYKNPWGITAKIQLHMDTKPLCFAIIMSVSACQTNYSILFLSHGFHRCHKPLVQHRAIKPSSVSFLPSTVCVPDHWPDWFLVWTRGINGWTTDKEEWLQCNTLWVLHGIKLRENRHKWDKSFAIKIINAALILMNSILRLFQTLSSCLSLCCFQSPLPTKGENPQSTILLLCLNLGNQFTNEETVDSS